MKIFLDELKETVKKLQDCNFQSEIFEILVNSLIEEDRLTIVCYIGAPSNYNYRERWLCQVVKKSSAANYHFTSHNILSDADDEAFDSREDAFAAGLKYVFEMLEKR